MKKKGCQRSEGETNFEIDQQSMRELTYFSKLIIGKILV